MNSHLKKQRIFLFISAAFTSICKSRDWRGRSGGGRIGHQFRATAALGKAIISRLAGPPHSRTAFSILHEGSDRKTQLPLFIPRPTRSLSNFNKSQPSSV